MITSLAWIPRGAARARPVRFELSSEEYARIKEIADVEEKLEKADINADKEHKQSGSTFHDANDEDDEDNDMNEDELQEGQADDDDELPAALRMDEYDDDESLNGGEGDDIEDEDIAIMEEGELAFAMDKDDVDDDEEAEDNEDDEIRPTDSLLVVAITEDEYSHLEVQLLSEDGNLYTHHDITLPDFPLCLAWLDCPPYQSQGGGQMAVGNYMAVGTFSPAIEIWNLDVLDPLEPSATLGGVNDNAPQKYTKSGKKSKKVTYLPGSHEAAVMSLSWNTTYRQALASGSADTTVKIWDVTTQACSHTFTHHSDKVQSVVWHSAEAWLLATGSFDRTLSLIDCRSGSTSTCATLPADIETLQWNPYSPYHLYCAMEDGQIICVDVRNTNKPYFTYQAHDQTVSAMSFSSRVPGMFATASIDKTVKVWDVNDLSQENAPKCVAYKTMNVGKLFALQYNGDDAYMLATAGDKAMVAVWETDEQEVIKNYFSSRVLSSSEMYTQLNSASQSTSSSQDIQALSEAINAPKPAQDDSWMDDNTGIAGAAVNNTENKEKKSKKEKKEKKEKKDKK